jgi:type I site-specific restriction endonuclease
MQQALDYASALHVPFVFSSNGNGFVFHDCTGQSAALETKLALDAFPGPAALWAKYRQWKNLDPAQGKIVLQPYYDYYGTGGKEPRYYQRNAINDTVEAIAKGQHRVLLVMATGTGKTYTAFQIIWRLWKSAWKLGKQKRVLFLADRNILNVMRITGDDPKGQAQLSNFIDPESPYPVIVTTSRLLSTGVDAQTCRLIVLDRAVGSMAEFKQIVGRGTRVHEDSKKYYFTLIDFRQASQHFADPDFDGEPVQIYEAGEDDPVTPPDELTVDAEGYRPPIPGFDETTVDGPLPPDITLRPGVAEPLAKYYINGKPVTVLTERVEYLDENGKLITESLRDYSRKAILAHYASLDQFLVGREYRQ